MRNDQDVIERMLVRRLRLCPRRKVMYTVVSVTTSRTIFAASSAAHRLEFRPNCTFPCGAPP
jgi:hypothetical protein